MSEASDVVHISNDSTPSTTPVAIFEKAGGVKTFLGIVRAVKNDQGAWTLRCSASAGDRLRKMRALIEAYGKKWLEPRKDGVVTSDPPDLEVLADLCRQATFEAEAFQADDYPLSLQLDRKTGLMAVATQNDVSLREWVDRAKEAVSLSKDFLDVVLKMSPLGLIPPAIILAVYVRRMGWSELLLESLGSASGLVALLAYMVLFMLLSILQFCLPSLLIAPLSGLLDHEKGDRRLNTPLAWLCLGLPLTWTVSYGLCVLLRPGLGTLSIGIATGIVAIADVIVVFCLKRRMSSSEGWRLYLKGWRLFLIGTCSFVGAISSVFPFLVLIQAVEKQSMSNDHPWVVLFGCAIVSVAGLFPGFVKINSELSGQTSGRTVVITLGALVGIAYLVSELVLVVAPISAYVLAASGVYSLHSSVYQLRKPELAAAFKAAHMPVFGALKGTKSSETSALFVGAFLRYNFGGSKLLCKYPFDPSGVTQREIEYARELQQPDPYLKAGKDCVPVKTDEVTPVHVDST